MSEENGAVTYFWIDCDLCNMSSDRATNHRDARALACGQGFKKLQRWNGETHAHAWVCSMSCEDQFLHYAGNREDWRAVRY